MIRNRSSQARRRATGWLLVTLVTVMSLFAARPAAAQGTSGALPGPISSAQLMRYADRLGLSPQQRAALEAIHDDYKVQFRVLREGEIAAFLQEQQSMQGGIPNRADVERLLGKMESILAKVERLDGRLFDRLHPLLTDRQSANMQRVRMARERDRYRTRQTAILMGRRTADLSELFLDLELPAEAFDAADPMIAQYERRLTTMMRKQAELAISMTFDVMDTLAEMGYSDITQEEIMSDPELMREIVKAVQTVYAEINEKAIELAGDLKSLNDRTYRQVAAVLPDDAALSFRNAYYRKIYPELALLIDATELRWFDDALDAEGVTGEQRAEIDEAAAVFRQDIEQLIERGIRAIDEYWKTFQPMNPDTDAIRAYQEELAEIRQAGDQVRKDALAALERILGAAKAARIRNAAPRPTGGTAPGAASDAVAGGPDDPAESDIVFSGDQLVPPRISRRDVRGYMDRLDLDPDQRAVVTALHDDYIEQHDALPVLDELREARQALRQQDEETGRAIPATIEAIANMKRVRREALAEIQRIDASFFENLQSVVDDDRRAMVERLRLDRVRDTYSRNAGSALRLGRDRSEEPSVDLVGLIYRLDGARDYADRLEQILDEYRPGAIEALRQRFEAQIELQFVTEKWIAAYQRAIEKDIAAVAELQARYRDDITPLSKRVDETNRAIIELNRRTLDEMIDVLPEEQGVALRRAYNLEAYPTLFSDQAAVHRQLDAALALDELTTAQRQQLDELAAMYRPEYERLSRAMIDVVGEGDAPIAIGFDADDFKRWQKREQRIAKLRYDRNELNARAIQRLRLVLTEDQVARIGGLPEPVDLRESSNPWEQ